MYLCVLCVSVVKILSKLQSPIPTMERGTRLGPYEIVESIGSGGMGEVFRARDTRLDRSVAIKILPAHLSANEDFRKRFEREARAISAVSHPNICTLHDVGSENGFDYLVMELCDGQTLADRLLKGPIPLDQSLRIAIQIADALDRAHRSGIVHRDLKPGNIMLTKAGAKLLDFGLAKGGPPAPGSAAAPLDLTQQKPITREGTIVGTFQYMAPEQFEGIEADARSDLFAFGAVLYEMVSGRRAFDGKTQASLIASIMERNPVPLSEIQPVTPPSLERLVRTCLEKSPDDRWQSAHDLRRELEWIRDGATSTAAGATTRLRSRLPWIAALIVLPLLSAAGTFLWIRRTTAAPARVVSAISPPPETRFVVTGDAAGPVTLSPDGRQAAFVATGTGTGTSAELWVQSLETGASTRLRGTGSAMFPFWSPDSRSLAFFAAGKLLTIDLDGSPPRILAEAADARGGAWTPDGHIIFTPQTQNGLFRVAVAGGAVTPLTELKPPYSTHRWPAMLPDGKHFIYLAAMHGSPASPDTAIFVASLDGKENRKLFASAGNAIPYRDYLLYTNGERLVAQRLKEGKVSGLPVPVWDGVLYDPGTWRSVFSISNTGLLATYPPANRSGSRLVWLDRSGKELGEIGAPAIYRDIALSPDGGKLALTIGDPLSVLYVEDLRRHVRSRLSFLNSIAHPVWTADGRSVVFNHLMDNGHYEILIKPADGSAPERQLFEAPYTLQPTSIDGNRGAVLFNALPGGGGDVMGVPLSGGKPFVVAGGPHQQANGMVSPDGRWLAYIEVGPAGRAGFITRYPDGGPKWQVSEDTIYWMWWSGGGSEIQYLTGDGQLKATTVTFEGNAVELSAPQLLFRVSINTNRRGLTMTPDGKRIAAAITGSDYAGPATLVSNFDRDLERP